MIIKVDFKINNLRFADTIIKVIAEINCEYSCDLDGSVDFGSSLGV